MNKNNPCTINIDKLSKLKQSEQNVLRILWDEDQPLMASEIAKKGGLINSTVQLALRNLLKNNIISVMDIVVNVTALSRKYIPNITKSEYENILLAKDFKRVVDESITNPSFVAALVSQRDLETANAEIDALQNLINTYKDELKKREDL